MVAGLSSSTDGQVGHTHGGDDFWLVRLQGEGVGVAEQDAWPELCAWMDPTGGAIMVAAGAAVQGLLHLVLYDASGRRCGAWGQPTGASTLRLPVGDLASGVHLLHVSDGQRTAMRRVLQLR